jgi:arsenate reductase
MNPDDKIYHVLFICTRNSARSIMAEGMLNHLGRGRFRAWSAGSYPAGAVHPLALATLADMNLPTEGYRSKDWNEFATPEAPHMDFVLTVCDKAAGEACPTWPGQPMSAHWGVADPAEATGDEAERAKAFRDAASVLRRRIELMLSLPLDALDTLSLQREIQSIGKQ